MAYGEYAKSGQCPGKCLYQLSRIGVPLHIVDSVIFENSRTIRYRGKPFASYQWLGDDVPYFHFFPDAGKTLPPIYADLQRVWFQNNCPELLESGISDKVSAFMAKWQPVAIERSNATGKWIESPSRIYWVLAYDLGDQSLLACANDLLACTDEVNSATIDAKRLVSNVSMRGSCE